MYILIFQVAQDSHTIFTLHYHINNQMSSLLTQLSIKDMKVGTIISLEINLILVI